MSSQAAPITPHRFAAALRDLQLSSLHAKAAELRNSIAHLQRSNDELQPLAADGDKDCADAIWENLQVIKSMSERLDLLKAEVENRGFLWDVSDAGEVQPGQLSPPNEAENPDQSRNNGSMQVSSTTGQSTVAAMSRSTGGTLDDDELRRRLAEQMEEDDEGVHL